MHIDVGTPDSINQREAELLRSVVAEQMPTHEFQVQGKPDGMKWIVLAPKDANSDLLKFTVCKIDPNVVVMIEHAACPRQFRTMANIEKVAQMVRVAAAGVFSATSNVHMAPEGLQ